MPELPEVHTTVEGLKRVIIGKTVKDVWSDFHIATAHGERKNIKNKKYYDKFKRTIKGAGIISVERKGKNILINLNNGYTFIVHMKMTGHLMYGRYKKSKVKSHKVYKEKWVAIDEGPLQDPFNKFIHFAVSLSDGKNLVFSDMRKFGSITISKTDELHTHDSVGVLGIDPLDKELNPKKLYEIIHRKGKTPIKSALLDQRALAGIGNIYSDEILWECSIHPLSYSEAIPEKKFSQIYKVMKKILNFSISKGGDSKSDYRNAFGEKGGFQNFHKVYGERKKKCRKINCRGIIERIVVRGRSAHFCPVHQLKFVK